MFGTIRRRKPQGAATLLADAWRRVLDAPSFAADTSFNEAGGDSLQLLKLIFLIEEALAIRLPMEACHVGLRPSALLRIVEAAMQPAPASVIEPPGSVFLIPGLGGETLLEGGFCAACAPAMRVAGVDLPDWPEMVEPHFAMEHIVERTAQAIAIRAPAEPIRLAGFCFGGHVAFGAAQLLTEWGREVAFVGILDASTTPHPKVIPRGTRAIRVLRVLRWELHNLLRYARRGAAMDWAGLVTAKLLAEPGKRWRLGVAKRIRHAPLPAGFVMLVNVYMGQLLRARLLSAWQEGYEYRNRLNVPVVLFRSEEHAQDGPDLGWHALCPDLRVIKVCGVHLTMLRPPHIGELSRCFIDEANRTLERFESATMATQPNGPPTDGCG